MIIKRFTAYCFEKSKKCVDDIVDTYKKSLTGDKQMFKENKWVKKYGDIFNNSKQVSKISEKAHLKIISNS